MVSRKRLVLTLGRIVSLGALAVAGIVGQAPSAEDIGRTFYADDPLWREPAPRTVHDVAVRKVDDIYDFLENSYVTPGREGKIAKRLPLPALDVNTVGEVPDNAWYTNRHALRRMQIPELQKGPGNTTPPSPNGVWTIIGAKSDGVTPGFVIEDANKNRYLLKFDPPGYPELCSAADVIGSKFFYALGYDTPENYVVHFSAENLAIPAGTMWRDAAGRKHSLTRQTIKGMLRSQPKSAGGTYRALASRWLPGEVVGPFSYRGTRNDDPNDTIPHEDRRELRGLAVFSAWLNHHDTRSINSMDTLVVEDGRKYLKHYLIDFGSILGSAGYGPKQAWIGHQHYIARKDALVQAVTLGFYAPRWVRADSPDLTGVGLFDASTFEPEKWMSNYPNPAFLMMDTNDAFWASKKVAAFTDDEIRAIVATGEFSDPKAADWIAESLIQRRDKIAATWFSKVLPLDKFRVTEGRLAFSDLSAVYGVGKPRVYVTDWLTYDNRQHLLTGIANARGARVPATDARTEYLAARIACDNAVESSCPSPVLVYLRRAGTTFEVVGVER